MTNREPLRHHVRRILTTAAGIVIAFALSAGGSTVQASPVELVDVDVVVIAEPGRMDEVDALLDELDATVVQRFDAIEGAAIRIDPGALDSIARATSVLAVGPDRAMQAESLGQAPIPQAYDTAVQPGSMYQSARRVGAPTYWARGFTGAGIDVALVDTGVAKSAFGLAGRVVAGTDTTGGGNSLRDGFGHGTHLAGIIAGNAGGTIGSPSNFNGIAAGSRLVSVRVADDRGATSTASVIAGLDWVLRNRSANGLNIRVVNLSFGAPPGPSYSIDPLAVAVERLWFAGVVVVVAGGNSGPWGGLAAPANDPYVIAVGAADSRKTVDPGDDVVASYSSANETWQARTVDLVAPGRSIQSSRGGSIADAYPGSVISESFLRGTGSSQSAAMVSGAAALIVDQRPGIRPDQVKALLRTHAEYLSGEDGRRQGGGMLRLDWIFNVGTPVFAFQLHLPARSGFGALDGSWDGSRRAGSRWAGSRWAGQAWLTSWN